jgi:hypothetical protein
MSLWTPERRNQVIAITIGTAGLILLLWFSLVASLEQWRKDKESKRDVAQRQLLMTQSLVRSADEHSAEVRRRGDAVTAEEGRMAHGDLYRWVMNQLLEMEERHDVRFAAYEPPQLGDLEMPPHVAYPVAAYSANGSAPYAQFGSFLADLENSHPYVRLRSLSLQSGGPGLVTDGDPERLFFRLDFVSLVTTNDVAPAP